MHFVLNCIILMIKKSFYRQCNGLHKTMIWQFVYENRYIKLINYVQ